MLPTDRFPLITEAGYQTLRWLEEHPSAPRFTHPGYHRLTAQGLARAKTFAQSLETPPQWQPKQPPAWVSNFVSTCYRNVPFYRQHLTPPDSFFHIPTTSRADLNREPWAFVPDDQALDDLVIYNTSGVTGHPLSILTHPDVLALYIPLLLRALSLAGLTPTFSPERVGIAYIGYQQQTYTYAAVSPLLNDAALVKVNLHPGQWRNPSDSAQFLNECNPVLYSGTPLAFAQLTQLPLMGQPTALLSTSMTLTPGLRAQLEAHFHCPVLDFYSTNETGPIAVNLDQNTFTLLQPNLYLEILDEDDQPCPPGQRGEVTVTGGFNPFLPLLRYRTGDYAALTYQGTHPRLIDLQGRPPVIFRTMDGTLLNNIDISMALRPYPIAQFQLHQFADGSLRLRRQSAGVDDQTLRATLLQLFGPTQPLSIEDLPTSNKARQYTSDLPTT